MIQISDEEFAGMIQSKPAMEKVLTRIVDSAIEETLRYIPRVAAEYIKNATTIQVLTDKFKKDNPTFMEHKEIVEKTVFTVETEHPGWTYAQVLEEATVRINKVLKTVSVLDKQQGLPFTVEN